MKRKRNVIPKVIALAVCLIMLVTCMPQTITAVSVTTYVDGLEPVALEENEKPGEEPEYALPDPDYPEIIADKAADHAARLPFKEEMNTLVYINDDGTETLYMFGMDVKYTDESGEIKDKSTKLALSEEGYYNPDNDIRVNFAKALDNGVSVTYNDIVISVRPAELKESVKQAELRKIALPEEDERERVVYADAFEKADIVYTPTFDGFKEDIVVNEYNGVTEYVFTAFTENARIEGQNIFCGEERIGDIGAVYVLDSEGECTYGVLEAEEIEPGEYILTVSVDAEFLENAAYPVYIDPSITIYSYSSGPKLIEDAPVYSNSSSAYGTNKYNYCGYVSSSLGYGRVLYRLTGLTSDYTYYQITASQINSVILHLREASGKSGSATVTARPFLETWTESTVKYSNVNINNYNTNSTYAASKTYSSSPKWWGFEIKEIAKAWKNNTFNSWYGIVLINSNESSSTYYRNFLSTEYTNSSYYPYITMDYTPNIVVSPSTKTLYVGQTCQLSATTCPSGISYTWESSNNSVATVSSTGNVTAVAAGTATITANGGSNGSGTCVVTVLAGSLSLNYTNKSLYVTDTFTLTATTTPSSATVSFNVTQGSSHISISGSGKSRTVTGLSAGSATIKVTTPQATKYCYITVNPIGVSLNKTSKTIAIGDSFQLTATAIPAGDTIDFTVTQSGNIVSLSGMGSSVGVTGLSIGTATVTATTSRGAMASCTVTVTPRFNISQTNLVLSMDDLETLTADCAPAPDTTHPVTWSITSGSSHISIDPDGTECTITPLARGIAVITATYMQISKVCTVAVNFGWKPYDEPTVYTRSSWGARSVIIDRLVSRTREPEMLIFHHSAEKFSSTDIDSVKAEIRRIQDVHMDDENKCDIAYHYIIDPAGRIWQGAMIDDYKRGHAEGHFDDIGVLLLGDFESRFLNSYSPNVLNQSQKDAMEQLSKWLCYEYDLTINVNNGITPIETHRSVCDYTVCPGENAAPWIESTLRQIIHSWHEN